MLTGGQVHDSKAAVDVLSGINISGSNILGDKAYGTEKIRTYIAEQNAKYTIPPRKNNTDPWYCDYWLYKERHLVECFLIKSKLFAALRKNLCKNNQLQKNDFVLSFFRRAFKTSLCLIWDNCALFQLKGNN